MKKDDLFNELITYEYLADLLYVGTNKLVGYLPLSTIKESCPSNAVSLLQEWAELNGLSHHIFKTGQTWSGSLYIWQEKGLKDFLIENASVFLAANVPIKPFEYIQHIESVLVPQDLYPEAYILIAKSFNDHRFRTI